jgi:hypothetical protein
MNFSLKKLLFFLACFLILLAVGYALFLVMAVNESAKKSKEKILVTINNPECFLPIGNNEVKVLLKKLKNIPEWKLATASEEQSPNTKGLLARWRKGNAEVTLFKIENKNIWFVNSSGYLTESVCDGKEIQLNVHYDEISAHYGSTLLLENEKVGLLIQEWSMGRDREGTKDAVNILRDEISRAMK